MNDLTLAILPHPPSFPLWDLACHPFALPGRFSEAETEQRQHLTSTLSFPVVPGLPFAVSLLLPSLPAGPAAHSPLVVIFLLVLSLLPLFFLSFYSKLDHH